MPSSHSHHVDKIKSRVHKATTTSPTKRRRKCVLLILTNFHVPATESCQLPDGNAALELKQKPELESLGGKKGSGCEGRSGPEREREISTTSGVCRSADAT